MSSTRRSMKIFYKVLSFLPSLPQEQSFDLLFLFLQAYEHWTQRIENEERLGQPQSVLDMFHAIRACHVVRYPALGDFSGLQDLCRGHLERYPGTPPPFLGAAWLMHNDEDFEGQDEWNEMRLNNQRTRYSVHINREHWYEVDGLGLPFERLYFDTREQLVHATNALADLQAERLRHRSEEFARTGRSRSI